MKRLIILNGQLIFPDRIDTGKALICKNGKIEQILADKMLEINPDDQIIDAKQQYVSPGLSICMFMEVADMISWTEQ